MVCHGINSFWDSRSRGKIVVWDLSCVSKFNYFLVFFVQCLHIIPTFSDQCKQSLDKDNVDIIVCVLVSS